MTDRNEIEVPEGGYDPRVEAALAALLTGKVEPFIPTPDDVKRALEAADRVA